MAQHGGYRPGSGRKPNYLKRLAKEMSQFDAAATLGKINAESKLIKLADDANPMVRLATIRLLLEYALGKPAQALDLKHSGAIENPIDLSKLDNETLGKLAAIAGVDYRRVLQ